MGCHAEKIRGVQSSFRSSRGGRVADCRRRGQARAPYHRFTLWRSVSPVQTLSEMFYADIMLVEGARLSVPAEYVERAAYIIEGSIELLPDDGTYSAGQLLIFKPGAEIILRAHQSSPARMMLLGGEPMDGARHTWWNFVSSSHERIEQAKEEWRMGRFAPVPEETEFIPLPDSRPAIVRYP